MRSLIILALFIVSSIRAVQICPPYHVLSANQGTESIVFSITLTNPTETPLKLALWANDTFNNPREEQWRTSEAPAGKSMRMPSFSSVAQPPLRLGPKFDFKSPSAEDSSVQLDERRLIVHLNPGQRPSRCVAEALNKNGWSRRLVCPGLLSFRGRGCNPEVLVYDEAAHKLLVRIPESMSCTRRQLQQFLQLLDDDGNILFVEKDIIAPIEGSVQSFNPNFPSEWPYDMHKFANPLNIVNATSEWSQLAQFSIEESPAVMVIDTYVNLDHPDLAFNLAVNLAEKTGLPGVDDDGDGVIDNILGLDGSNIQVGDPRVPHGSQHGTYVSGIVAARPSNDLGVSGFAPNARIVPCGAGDQGISVGSAVACMQWAVQNAKRMNIRVLNHSYRGDLPWSEELKAFQALADIGMIHTVATGNDEVDLDTRAGGPWTPLKYLEANGLYSIIGAPRLDEEGKPAPSGYSVKHTYFYAPGHLAVIDEDPGAVAQGTGTSFSSPAVAGLIAGMLTVNPLLTVFDVLWIVENTIIPQEDLRGKCKWAGRPDFGKAIAAAEGTWLRMMGDHPIGTFFEIQPNQSRTFDFEATFSKRAHPEVDLDELKAYIAVYIPDDVLLNGALKIAELSVVLKKGL